MPPQSFQSLHLQSTAHTFSCKDLPGLEDKPDACFALHYFANLARSSHSAFAVALPQHTLPAFGARGITNSHVTMTPCPPHASVLGKHLLLPRLRLERGTICALVQQEFDV